MFFVFLPSYMDAEEEAAAVPAAGGEAEEGDGEGERRGGGGGGEEAWRAAAPPGSGGRRRAAAGPPRASKASPRSRGRRSKAAPVRPRRRRPGGRFPAARLTRPYGPAAATELGPGGRLPGAEGLGGGASHTQQARGCLSYRGDEHPPQPQTGLHHRRPAPDAMLRGNDASRSGRTAAERKRRRRRRQRRCQPRAAAAPGGKGRRAAREERPERRFYGGPAGTRRLPRSPAGQRGAWRASCGAARRGAGLLLLRATGMCDPRTRGAPKARRQDPWLPCTGFPNFLNSWSLGSKVPRGPRATGTPASLSRTHLVSACHTGSKFPSQV